MIDIIKSNIKEIEKIKGKEHCILEDTLIVYGYYSIFDIKNMCMVVQNCSLDFILGDPLGFLSIEDDVYQEIEATCFYEYHVDSEDKLRFKRYKDNSIVVFDAIDEYDEEDSHEIELELNTHRMAINDVLLLEADYNLHFRLIGNSKYIHCEKCGRLKPKDKIRTRHGKKVCRECTGRWVDKTTR